MAKDFAKKFYKTKEWFKCRSSYIKSVNGLCERCIENGEINTGYIVHHKIELNKNNIDDPNITLSHSNLEYLCLDCHNKHHKFDRKSKSITREGFKFNEKGELIPIDPL